MLQRNLFYILLALSGLAAAYGYWAWRQDPLLLGIVESRRQSVGAREGGLVREVLVATGDQVEAGQVLARLDAADLLAERDLLRSQLASLEGILAADRQRHALEYDLLRLRVSQQSASIQADLAELNALNQEIRILQQAERAGLGRDRDLARLLIQRDALQQLVAEQSALAQERTRTAASGAQADRDTVLASLLGDRVEQIHQLRRRLALVEQRIQYRTVTAPSSGRVVEILVPQGSTVDAYQPILTVEDPRVSLVEVYVPETQDRRVEVGQPVAVYSRRSNHFDTSGRIRFVHPGFSRMPERLWLRGQMLWARKLVVELDPRHVLMPGESVQVRILDGPAPGADVPPSPRGSVGATQGEQGYGGIGS